MAEAGASQVVMYCTQWCPHCARARNLLRSKGVAITEIDIESGSGLREQMQTRSGRRTVPQIFIGDSHVGGCDDLFALETRGELDLLLKARPTFQESSDGR